MGTGDRSELGCLRDEEPPGGCSADVRGRETEVKKHQGRETEVKKHQGREMEVKKHQGRETEVNKHQGREMEVKKHQGRETEVKKHQGREMEVKKHQGRETEVKKHQGREMEVKTHQGREMEVKKHQGREMEVKKHQGREMEVKKHKGREMEVEKETEVKKHQHKHNLKHRYELMETLGKGAYGKVKRAVERGSNRTVAIKSIRKERITDDLDRVHIQREIEITASLRHANIIRFHEVFESRDKIVIVMEFASRGELYDFIQEKRKLTENEARGLFRQIASAVHYCHKNGVVHRDLKLENILLDQDLNVKLADFGLSSRFQKDFLLQTYCGSPLYAAPEIVQGLPYQGPEVDCWALGVLLYALVYSSMPFDGANHTLLTQQIIQGRYHRPNPPSDACALIDWLLTVRVDDRATIEDVANHWWVNWGFEESVCDCPSPPHQECPSPLLARYIDWQNRVTAVDDSMTVDPAYPTPHAFYFSLPLKSDRGGGGGGGRARGASLRKSRKENAIPQNALGACGGACPTTSERKSPKGILKPQRSFDSVFPPTENSLSPPHGFHTNANPPPPPTFSQPSSKMPKKGILKNFSGGASPDRSLSGAEVKGGGNAADSCHISAAAAAMGSDSPTMRTEAVRRRKGILKRNGKFSRSLDLPDDLHSAAAVFPEALQQLLNAGDGRRSRPSSVVSEDSLFSSDSFDLLDLSAQSRRRIFSRGRQRSAGSSEDDLET